MSNPYISPIELQWIKGKAMSLSDCLKTNWGSIEWRKPSEDNVCFRNNYENQESACKGDSGGPLVCNVDGKAVLIGATSHGSIGWPCVDDGFPNIYARVSFFLSWVKENMVKYTLLEILEYVRFALKIPIEFRNQAKPPLLHQPQHQNLAASPNGKAITFATMTTTMLDVIMMEVTILY